MEHHPEDLKNLSPGYDFFVGVDSDGCVFDTMEIKQKECFCPNIIKFWDLQPIAKYVRETVEFVNLYSKWRGSNRFAALVKLFDVLAAREEVRAKGFALPNIRSLREWVASDEPLGNDALAKRVAESGDPILQQTLAWSLGINQAVQEIAVGIPPFPYVRESFDQLSDKADVMCVSQTPAEALKREWADNDLTRYVRMIAGQEYGSKSQQLALAITGKYPPDHVLMIGDALGDLKAAQAVGALFFPINPGREDESWQRFYEEGMARFFNRSFRGHYEAERIREFKALLPEVPPWSVER